VAFYVAMSIGSLVMWVGLIDQRCVDFNMGYIIDISNHTTLCTFDSDCGNWSSVGKDSMCMKSYFIPNTGTTSYDSFYHSIMSNYVVASLEGWSDITTYMAHTFKDSIGINIPIRDIYFFFLMEAGYYFLMKLFLAVLFDNYEKMDTQKKEKIDDKSKKIYDIYRLQLRKEADTKEKFVDVDKKKENFERDNF